ncbi:unnamed protein product [Strongylus vulgaris]|uniref:Uncharacterized protein n=1 Tax=Strongylus vulgaris TaxID=40348 RepID=A0A3P7JFK5_STRVU|nr:unnamed protein product [Strongylus vulgaris]
MLFYKAVEQSLLQIIPVKAVRIEPLSEGGYFAIDGEPCKSGSSFQVKNTRFCKALLASVLSNY